jgi:hypothetical protein
MEIIIYPIYKKGNDSMPENYRPISLVNTCFKMLTVLMSNSLNEWCEVNKKMSEFQAAYRKGYGCEGHVFSLNAILQQKLSSKNGRVYALFVDLSKAFDSINHSKLWSRLERLGVSHKFIAFLKNLYNSVRAKIRTPFGESDYFLLEKGVLQGESLSPKLFTLFIDEIVNILHSSSIPSLKIAAMDIHLLLYADDIVLLAHNAVELQSKIEILRKFFDDCGLNTNIDKTKCVVFRYKRRKKSSVPKLFWGGEIIEVVEKYKYQGVTFHSNLNYQLICDNFITRAKLTENEFFFLFSKSNIKTFGSRIKLFESLVRSVLTYCSPI